MNHLPLENIKENKTFNIGTDQSLIRKDENGTLIVYFREERFWVALPASQQKKAVKNIEKNGIVYIKDKL